jgi:hypothetical protein
MVGDNADHEVHIARVGYRDECFEVRGRSVDRYTAPVPLLKELAGLWKIQGTAGVG